MSQERAWADRCWWLLACVALVGIGCGGRKGSPVPQGTFHATFSNAAGTNATTSDLNLTFNANGSNGTMTASAVYLVANGTGAMTIIWSNGGSPERKIVINTSGTPAAGQSYDTDATQGASGANTFTYNEGDELWDGTGTIVIDSVDQKTTLVNFTADMAMQPDAASPGGAQGTFTIDVTSATAVFGL